MLNMGKCQQFHIEQPNNKYNNKNLQSSHSGRASHTWLIWTLNNLDLALFYRDHIHTVIVFPWK